MRQKPPHILFLMSDEHRADVTGYEGNKISQLFHLAADPNELINLYASRSDNAAELEAELLQICSPVAVNEQAYYFQEEQLKQIRELKLI